ncbi:MAG: ferritin-like domain-containing protein [Rikenellaceae bacterium]|nr:ferritin-like domain-containing protein [Rikenellaceae bacterium]
MATKTMAKPLTSNANGNSATGVQAQRNNSNSAASGNSVSNSRSASSTQTISKPTSRQTSKASGTTVRGMSRSAGRMQTGQEFKKFFVDELKDIYWAEKNLARALMKMKRAATSQELQAALEKHANETTGHIAVVEKIFAALGEKPKTKKCEAMDGLLTEANSIIKDTERDTFIRDAGLILAAQKVEHYEIATYGTLRIFAQYLKNKRVVTMLESILGNEKYTDVSLTKLAESFINDRAAQE